MATWKRTMHLIVNTVWSFHSIRECFIYVTVLEWKFLVLDSSVKFKLFLVKGTCSSESSLLCVGGRLLLCSLRSLLSNFRGSSYKYSANMFVSPELQ